MSYIVFARKYRPQTFDDVVGQSHITTTLKNAIAQSRVAHAYLFAGPRGVGKTTTARVFAKALNCEKGSSADPCNECASCKEITQGSSLDILEIDGASNRGIEEIRSLRENVKFAPAKGRFKVYIIDEVHMLTAEAFNALLKTLEEPPAHVKFIFATTNPHKVPPTILSRCQRFDFRRIGTKDALENLRRIVKDEKLNVGDEALALIARYGDGSMRDAQVILDQISSFSRGTVGVEDVTRVLGIVDDEVLFGLSAAIRDRDPKSALGIIDRLLNDGKDVIQTALGLIEHFRNISVARITGDEELLDMGADKAMRYIEESKRFTVEEALYVIYALANTVDLIRKSTIARVPLEAALIKLAQSGTIVPLAGIVSRIEAIEKGICLTQAAGPELARQGERTIRQDVAPQGPAAASVSGANPAPEPKEPAAEEPPLPRAEDEAQPPAPGTAIPAADFDEIAGCWAKVVSHIRPKRISVASYLEEGAPVALDRGTLTIGFPKGAQFHKDVLDSGDNRRIIEDALRDVLGATLKVTLIINGSAEDRPQGASLSGAGMSGGIDPAGAPDGAGESDPIVKAAIEIFGGKVAGNGNGKGSAR